MTTGQPNDQAMQETVELLAAELVLADPEDMVGLAQMHSLWEQAVGQAPEGSRAEAVARAGAVLVEQLVLRELDDPTAGLARVSDAVDALQRWGRDGDEAALLDWLGDDAESPTAEPEHAAAPQGLDISALADADPSLLSDFVQEAVEHLESADLHLLEVEGDPTNDESLNAVFRAFHTIKGVAGFLGLTAIGAVAHEAENLLDQARKGAILLSGPAVEVSFESVDALKGLVGDLAHYLNTGDAPAPRDCDTVLRHLKLVLAGDKRLGEILTEAGSTRPEAVEEVLAEQSGEPDGPRMGERLVAKHQVDARDVSLAVRSQKSAATGRQMIAKVQEAAKVDAERLDRLVDGIGELVIAETMVRQSLLDGDASSAATASHLNQLGKITRELQELGTALRMVPVRPTFQKMARLVRDLAVKSGKQVEFVTSGEDTELDKTVVDQIGDPLIHMIRNAVDHGLEPDAAAREAAGKPASGRVELRAFHRGGNIFIEIADDGRGLDRDAILSKALERGLVKEGQALSDREVFGLIFEPGFSTAKAITDVSGRGVGMDVVKRNIEALRGQVEIRSEPGVGSTFTIKLPLTLAVIDGMVIAVAGERYVIPTLSIVTTVRPTPEMCNSVLGDGEMLRVQGEVLPLFRLAGLFDVAGAKSDPTEALAVIVDDDGQRACLLVDELLGQQQIVIKSLGDALQDITGVSGGAIMPDGRVGLILDVTGLVRLAQESHRVAA